MKLMYKALVLVVAISMTTVGLGLVFLEDDPTEPQLEISPRTLNLGSNGNWMLFSIKGFGETPETFQSVGMDFGWDLLGQSAPIASFENVTLCPEGASPENIPICLLEKEVPSDATKFKVSRELVQNLVEKACEMGGCHPLDQGRKDQVNVTMWGEIKQGEFFEVNDLLEVIPECAPCRVTVTLLTIKYEGDWIGPDVRLKGNVTHRQTGKSHSVAVPSPNGEIQIGLGENKTLNKVIFRGVMGKKGDLIHVMIKMRAYEIDPGEPEDMTVGDIKIANDFCPFEETLVLSMYTIEPNPIRPQVANFIATFKVVADP